METGEKMRMCPYCEGTVPLESSSCRFCGSAFEEPAEKMKGAFREEKMDSAYNPPYSPGADTFKDSVYYPENHEEMESADLAADSCEEEEKGHIISLMLLSIGGMLITLSILLMFFSEHGRVVLEWKSRYWSLYMLLGLPFLYYGFKNLKKL